MPLLKEASVTPVNGAPSIWTEKNIKEMREDLDKTMLWMDWNREVSSINPDHNFRSPLLPLDSMDFSQNV
jgi:leucyl-tRNA synthetase